MNDYLGVLGVTLVLLVAGCSRPPANEPAAAPGLRIALGTGEVLGRIHEDRARVWSGIPYAAPPTGARRWQPPSAPDSWTGVRPTLEPGSPCAQPDWSESSVDGVLGNEDCLTLNVFTPLHSPSSPAPIMFWIHGGANYAGSGARFDGSRLAASHGVIVVTINYRLGPFGWFHHPAVTSRNSIGTGQFALLDMMAALRWVQEHAAAFGGDPANVTIFGESAGGQNVYALLLSPAAKGLFHQAISQSGGFWNMAPSQAVNGRDDPVPGTPASAREIIAQLLINAGEASDRQQGMAQQQAWTPEELHRWLLARSTTELLAPYLNQPNLGYDLPSVVYDGALLPGPDHQTQFADASYNQVPLIVGGNRDEQKIYQFSDQAFVTTTSERTSMKDPAHYEAYNRYYSDWWNFSGVDDLAPRLHTPVFAYRFDWDHGPQAPTDFQQLIGAAHGLEIPFVSGNFTTTLYPMMFTEENRAERQALSNAMMSYWAAFAHHGDPGRGMSGELPAWPAWSNGRAKLVFDAPQVYPDPATIDGAQLLEALLEDPYLTADEKCTLYRDHTMYPQYDLAGLRERGCRP